MSTKPGDESAIPALGLFEGFGVEIEYMIVDAESLSVRPVADRLLAAAAGDPGGPEGDVPRFEVERGEIAWSNELVLHVVEMKTNGPAPMLPGLSGLFHRNVLHAESILAPMECLLLPGGCHPWMDPELETRIWPHEHTEVYRSFDRIFSCRGHGWANLQATHLNLPFQGDDQFAALHAATRILLPLLPALAASSPILEGRLQGALDQRMVEYRSNSRRVPSVAGAIVPDAVDSRERYEREILGPIYRDLAPFDPEGILRHEWVNARGAIARFARDTIEIRILDAQECPAADLAVVGAVSRVTHDLCDRMLAGEARFDTVATGELAGILEQVVRHGETALVESRRYGEALELPHPGRPRHAVDLWIELLARSKERGGRDDAPEVDGGGSDPLRTILEEGPLARRILHRTGPDPTRGRLEEVYRELAGCLRENRVFTAR